MLFADVIAHLEARFHRELPGPDAQARLAPIPRRDWPTGFNHVWIRHAAGLLLVFPVEDHAHVVLTVRASNAMTSPRVCFIDSVVASSCAGGTITTSLTTIGGEVFAISPVWSPGTALWPGPVAPADGGGALSVAD